MLVHPDQPIDPDVLAQRTGWSIRDEGACKDDVCIPLPDGPLTPEVLSDRLNMAIASDAEHGLLALGPPVQGGRALDSATAPVDLEFEDFEGNTVRLADIRGSRTVVVSWAPW